MSIKKAAPSKYGLIGVKKVSFPKKPMEAPKITNTAGARQHEVARKAVMIVPKLEIFSFFIPKHQ